MRQRPSKTQRVSKDPLDPCPPTACYLVFPDRASAGVPDPPQFRCWISRRVAPNMAVIARSDDMTSLYDWPLEWELRASLDDPFFSSLQSSDPENWQLLHKLRGHFLKRLIAALLAPNGHFPSLLLSTLWGIQGGFTSLCVQGIFGSGKTYCASLLLVLVSTVLQLPTVLTAEPNLPLATAADSLVSNAWLRLVFDT